MASESSESKDDVIPVEDIIAAAGTPTGPVEEAVGKAPSEPTPDPGFVPDAQVIDDLLVIEDPEFSAAMREIQEKGGDGGSVENVEIDSLDLDSIEEEAAPGPDAPLIKRLSWRYFKAPDSWGKYLARCLSEAGPALLTFVKDSAHKTKTGCVRLVGTVRGWLTSYRGLPKGSKLLLWSSLVLGLLSLVTLKLSLSGQVALDLSPGFLYSFEDVADSKFVYAADEPREDLMDPLFHPEYIVAMDRFVINLKSAESEGGSNPMGLFSFYFEASNQECAVELKDREGEARDLLSRALEQMAYEDLVTPAGKEKLKLTLRKTLNTLLTKGQVRRVFFKNIVLKE